MKVFNAAEGIKECQMAGRSIWKACNEKKGRPRDALCRKLACYLFLQALWALMGYVLRPKFETGGSWHILCNLGIFSRAGW